MSKELFLTLLLLLAADPVMAQVSQRKIEPYDCEANDATLNVTHQTAGGKDLIIFIARLGDGEKNRSLNYRRLHNVRAYLTEFGWKRDPQTIILAEGERVKGYGRIEIYVKGILFDVLAVKTNGDLPIGSCEPDDIRPKKAEEIFYPYRDSSQRRYENQRER
jgi:hypothetical protein